MYNTELVRVAAATPVIKVADIDYNKNEIISMIESAITEKSEFIVFPELSLTGYTAGDLLHWPFLYEKQLEALADIVSATKDTSIFVVLGIYLKVDSCFYNCGAVIRNGEIIGVSPKTLIPNTGEFCEKRWFESGSSITGDIDEVMVLGSLVPFGNIIFKDEANDLTFAVEICRDLWAPLSPSTLLSLHGAQMIFNLSASNDFAGKGAKRRNIVTEQSEKCICAYVYASSGVHESTTDLVFSGHQLIAECGNILAENKRFERTSNMILADVDLGYIKFTRSKGNNLADCKNYFAKNFDVGFVYIDPIKTLTFSDKLIRQYAENPFLPENESAQKEYCEDVFNIQVAALAKRLEHIGVKKTVIGVSGGLDSTLALMVAARAHELLGLPISNIIAVTMPGFGTSDHTHDNAVTMMKLLGVDMREISIKSSVLQHFEDIGHDKDIHDLTYENAQARERTQILMDVAGMEGGLTLGTGDLSETALGWCTFNGDHMAMYGVNGSVPKTLIPHILHYVMDTYYTHQPDLKKTIQSVIDTPISPELLPPSADGSIKQKTEDKVGPYVLHDFFLYHTMITGMGPAKLFFVAKQCFEGKFDTATIKKWLIVFYKRFITQQYKRNTTVDCPKSTQISLSPRGGISMPSDAVPTAWLKEAETL